MKTIAVYNVKGGVGKTTTCVNLAYLSSKDTGASLLWDLDPQGGATFYLGEGLREDAKLKKVVKDKKKFEQLIQDSKFDNLKMIPAFFGLRYMDTFLEDDKKPGKRLAKILTPLEERFDYVFIDCPPSISNLSESIFHVADILLIPVIPSMLSMQSLQQIKDHLKEEVDNGPVVMPFFSMVDRRKKLHKDLVEQGLQSGEFLQQSIYYRSVIEQMGVNQAPLPTFAPKSEESFMYEALWGEIEKK